VFDRVTILSLDSISNHAASEMESGWANSMVTK